MTNHKEEPGKFHTVHAERDLEANWEVDLAKQLEEYLFKICSGEITGTEEDNIHLSVNFAEAALLLQGSVQVYSRKVEYLYNLVLHALDFLSQKRQQEQSEGGSILPGQAGLHAESDDENDQFWGLDDIPVDARNCLDTSTSKDVPIYHFVKPPANLVVLESDCLDNGGDNGELESYLLGANELYRDFILLDPCDAVAVNDFLGKDDPGKGQTSTYKDRSARKGFQSPTRCYGGTANKSSLKKKRDAIPNQSPKANCNFGVNDCEMGPASPAFGNNEDDNDGFDTDNRYSDPAHLDDSDSGADYDDPWKPLNPHEAGNLKVKPFKKVKAFRRNVLNSLSSKQSSITELFPLAKLHGTISPELMELWETQCKISERCGKSQSPPMYEKLRQSLANGGHSACDDLNNDGNDKDDGFDDGIPDFGEPDNEMHENMYMDEGSPFHREKHDDSTTPFTNASFECGGPSSQASLEDLCRSHLDALLANIAESEKQTELAARVSSWKQKLEHNLEEQDSHPPFDIHVYGERILEKLSLEVDNGSAMSFANVVTGQEKHDVARSFSALLQLVNNGDIDLDRGEVDGESICYTAVNPFHIRLLGRDKRRDEAQFRLSKKRAKSPLGKEISKIEKGRLGRERSSTVTSSSQGGLSMLPSRSNSKLSVKLGKIGGVRCTPAAKRRRRSRLVEPLDLHSAG